MKIKVKTRTDERNKISYYREFEIVKQLPEIGSVEELAPERDGEKTTIRTIFEAVIDCEQGCDKIYDYHYYVIIKTFEQLNDNDEWEIVNQWEEYVALKKN